MTFCLHHINFESCWAFFGTSFLKPSKINASTLLGTLCLTLCSFHVLCSLQRFWDGNSDDLMYKIICFFNVTYLHEVHTLVPVEDGAVVDGIEEVWRVVFGSGGKPFIPLSWEIQDPLVTLLLILHTVNLLFNWQLSNSPLRPSYLL